MRLTEKHGNIYFYNYDKDCDDETREYRMLTTHNKIVNKLGRLEDLEEELGIDLITLFKALKNGIYTLYDKEEYIEGKDLRLWNCCSLLYFRNIDDRIAENQFMTFEYGKTWALTKEELE